MIQGEIPFCAFFAEWQIMSNAGEQSKHASPQFDISSCFWLKEILGARFVIGGVSRVLVYAN